MAKPRTVDNISNAECERVKQARIARKATIKSLAIRTDALKAIDNALDDIAEKCRIVKSSMELFPEDNEWHRQAVRDAEKSANRR